MGRLFRRRNILNIRRIFTIKKLQLFYQLKFNSTRLKKSKYNIDITIDEARKNSELISVGDSELIRTLFLFNKKEFFQKDLYNLIKKRKEIKKLPNNEENRLKLSQENKKIDDFLFISDLITVEFENKSHYREILKKKGFFINGTRYTPFMSSAGQIRRNSATFINNSIKYQIIKILENDRNVYTPITYAKFGAYFSLYSSTTHKVSFPRIAIIPDKEKEIIKRVDFVEYVGIDVDDTVTEKDHLIKFNFFDGQGLITPAFAKKWSDELGLDYTFSTAIIRAPFLKGMVAVFDIEMFANEISKTYYFEDIYGNTLDARNIDVFISQSMFKLWDAYNNTESYVNSCHKNNLGFGVAKVNSKNERSYSRTSYQFLQILNLDDRDIAKLCEPTIDWVRSISGGSPESMLLYATGENAFDSKDFDKMDVTTKAILLNPELARDRYIQSKFIKTIEKKKKESYMGSLLLNANYQIMISDIFHQAAHIFKIEKLLLNAEEHYSEYWLNKKIKSVAAIRSPIVHHSELNILNIQDREDTAKWYSHIHSGIIYPANGVGVDCMLHADSDFDGDLVCTINNDIIIKGKIPSLPISYESVKMEKLFVDAADDEKMVESQLLGHSQKVGYATNVSSSLYCLLNNFIPGSMEHSAILNRLKIGRKVQGEIIDSVKGLKVPPFRDHWTKYRRITEDMTPEEKEKWIFNNRILCEVRPAFFRFLYPHYMTRYNKEIKKYNIYSHLVFKKDFIDIFTKTNKTEEENNLIEQYKWNSFFLDNGSVVNSISRYMRGTLGMVDKYSSKNSRLADYTSLLNKEVKEIDTYKLEKMKEYLQHYKSFKRGMWHDLENAYDNLDAFVAYLKKECYSNISSNESELATYAVHATYGNELSMVEFAWKMFPSGLLENIQTNSNGTIKFPVPDPDGEIEYLWNRYTMSEISLEDING